MSSAFLVHLACTWMLVGLIWVVQILAYPQFLRVAPEQFPGYHWAHCWRIGFIIAPLIAIETGSAAWLLYSGQRDTLFLMSAGLMPIIWLSTALLQAPVHVKLMRGYDAALIQRLLATNWVRTLAWTARGILLGYLAVK